MVTLCVLAVGRQIVMHKAQHMAPLAAGGGNLGLLGLSEASVPVGWCVSLGWDLVFLWSCARGPGRVVPASGGPACASVHAEHLF